MANIRTIQPIEDASLSSITMLQVYEAFFELDQALDRSTRMVRRSLIEAFLSCEIHDLREEGKDYDAELLLQQAHRHRYTPRPLFEKEFARLDSQLGRK